jgi:hypothetical protein
MFNSHLPQPTDIRQRIDFPFPHYAPLVEREISRYYQRHSTLFLIERGQVGGLYDIVHALLSATIQNNTA